MAKMGRPKIEYSFDELNKLCHLHCTMVECAYWFGISEDTLTLRIKEEFGLTFPEYFKIHASSGKMALRRHQFKAAEKGNVTMQIWLGKQMLEQSDKNDMNITERAILEIQGLDDDE